MHLTKYHCLGQTRCDDNHTSVRIQTRRQDWAAGPGTPPRVDKDKSLCRSCLEIKTLSHKIQKGRQCTGAHPTCTPLSRCNQARCLLLEARLGTDHGAGPAGARLKDTSVQTLAPCPRLHGLVVCCLQTLLVRTTGRAAGAAGTPSPVLCARCGPRHIPGNRSSEQDLRGERSRAEVTEKLKRLLPASGGSGSFHDEYKPCHSLQDTPVMRRPTHPHEAALLPRSQTFPSSQWTRQGRMLRCPRARSDACPGCWGQLVTHTPAPGARVPPLKLGLRNSQHADISECSSQPCQNGGTCLEGVNQYTCICPPGRTGSQCQHQAQTAAPERLADDPAFSRAPRCAQVERTRHCSCEAGFQLSGAAGGDSVCQDVNECELYGQEGRPRLCMHTCVNTPGSYRCACPSGYRTLPDRKSCEDIDECVSPQHLCPRGTLCINTGGGFQCVSPECPEGNGNVSYVKTSPFQCERNPCPMDSRPCRHLPKTISFHYLSLPSNLTTPITLFRMAMASVPGRPGPNSLRFGIVGGNSRGHFVMQRADRQTGELILIQTLEGPQTLEVDVDMSEYLDRSFQANHVSKVTIFVSPYDF